MRASIDIGQPEGSPLNSSLTVPALYADRFEAVESRVNRSRQNIPDRPFIAAAVLSDADEELGGDANIAKLARDLAAADAHLREPNTPFVMASRAVYLQAGKTATDGGLFIRNNDYGLPTPTAVIPVAASLETDVDVADETKPKVTIATGSHEKGFTTFLSPRHVLTTDNLGRAAEVSRKFLDSFVLVVGNDAMTAFFRNLLAKKAGSKGAERRRLVAEQVIGVLKSDKNVVSAVGTEEDQRDA